MTPILIYPASSRILLKIMLTLVRRNFFVPIFLGKRGKPITKNWVRVFALVRKICLVIVIVIVIISIQIEDNQRRAMFLIFNVDCRIFMELYQRLLTCTQRKDKNEHETY